MSKVLAVVQFCATAAVQANLDICRRLIASAVRQGATVVCLPEASDFIAAEPHSRVLELTRNETPLFVDGLKELARRHNIWITAGIHRLSNAPSTLDPALTKTTNVSIVLNSDGVEASSYSKIHLFDYHGASLRNPRLMESDNTLAGSVPVAPIQTPVGMLGQAICYDIRFPQLAHWLSRKGADIILYPSAFTLATGEAHWEVLLRARAIETQCYVAAAAQVGKHSPKRASYGHSMIVDPFGRILAEADGQSEAVILAPIDTELIASVRERMPISSHHRQDVNWHS
ncbi:nitrilase and fragile histidine triad fusion protein NitFhit [Ramicandelaber brevisporus]|nr:nitrilase and fragile histidine triad fusion protein NitFhit [Ramicandelaber brevisporus]